MAARRITKEALAHISGNIIPEQDNKVSLGTSSKEFKYLKPVANICHIEVGTYKGDGSTGLAVAVAFDPKYVRIWLDDAAGASKPVFEATDNFTSAVSSKDLDGDTDLVDDAIIALGTLSFTVDDAGGDAHPNTNNQQYNYLALG